MMRAMQIELTGVTADRLLNIMEAAAKRSGDDSAPKFKANSVADRIIVVAGREVCMRIIGEMAAQGEACLVRAELLTAFVQ